MLPRGVEMVFDWAGCQGSKVNIALSSSEDTVLCKNLPFYLYRTLFKDLTTPTLATCETNGRQQWLNVAPLHTTQCTLAEAIWQVSRTWRCRWRVERHRWVSSCTRHSGQECCAPGPWSASCRDWPVLPAAAPYDFYWSCPQSPGSATTWAREHFIIINN